MFHQGAILCNARQPRLTQCVTPCLATRCGCARSAYDLSTGTFRVADVLLTLRAYASSGFMMPVPLVLPEEGAFFMSRCDLVGVFAPSCACLMCQRNDAKCGLRVRLLVEPFLCPPPSASVGFAAAFLKSMLADRADCYLALLPGDIRRQVRACLGVCKCAPLLIQ